MKESISRALIPIGASLLGLLAIATYSGTPKARAATPATMVSFSCRTSTPCATLRNRGSGIAIDGRADNNSGIQGSTLAPTSPLTPVNGFLLGLTGGIVGNDLSTTSNATNLNQGVAGFSANSDGMYGVTANTCNCGRGTDVDTFSVTSGVFGFDAGPSNGFAGPANAGVAGQSLSRVGGIFLSRTGYGAVGRTFTGTGVLGVSRAAGGVALAATTLQGGPLFRGFNATGEVASLDSNGDLVIAGSLRTGGVPQFASKSANGSSVVTYGGRQSMATVEDFGAAQMHSGYAEVRLDPAFAQLMDQHTSYMVFITAEGDNRGLYVASKTYTGFTVRESQAGRSTLALSYRIVARAFGAHDSRFAIAPPAAAFPASAIAATGSRSIPVQRRIGE